MTRIAYLLDDTQEPDRRLEDAILFAALATELGEQIEAVDRAWARNLPSADTVWGRDQFRSFSARLDELREGLQQDAVQKSLGAQIIQRHQVPDAMADLGRRGLGAILRNMRDPAGYIRYTQAGDRFEQHASAIRAEESPYPIFVQPNHDLCFNRRYVIAGGEIAGHGPYRYCSETPLELLDPSIRDMQCRDFMSPLEPAREDWTESMSLATQSLLNQFPLVSGVIDVGIKLLDGHTEGAFEARIEMVEAARPGAAWIMHADPVAYARKVAEHLPLIAPSLEAGSSPSP